MRPSAVAPQSLADYLWHWEQTSPDRLFTSDGSGARFTYLETAERVRALCAEFARRGAVRGQHVAVLAENSSAWVIAFLAAIASGLVAVPLATRLSTDELDAVLDDADPTLIAVDAGLLAKVAHRWGRRSVLIADPYPPAAEHRSAPTDGAAPACLTYTSGTTGRPKGVMLSNAALTHASETYASMFHSTPKLHTIIAVPLCHNTGFIDQLGHALVAGGSVEPHRRFHAGAIADALQEGECSYFIGVPTMYHRIVDHLVGVLPCERAPWLAFGGAPMPSQLIARMHQQFPRARLANCYGLSEATSITHINFLGRKSSTSAVGVAVAGTIDRISPSGELLIRSPTTMLGYHRDPSATEAKFEDGWLRTGDLALRSADGMVHVYGRVDEVINRGGEKVVPLEVEEALRKHPSIVEAAVVGLPDDEYGSIVAAAVVTSGSMAPIDLVGFLDGALADFKRPAHIVQVDHLPRNDNGKVVTADVRDLIMRTRKSGGEQR
jgi:acyl-CoA synthetase (AMP-forming)/AMP-acid ligase II